MANALDKIVRNDKPFHKQKEIYTVPALWMETQFSGDESISEIIERLLIWLRHGWSKEELDSFNKFKTDNPNLDFQDARWNTWSYCDFVCGFNHHKEIVEELFPKVKELPKGDRVDLIVASSLDR